MSLPRKIERGSPGKGGINGHDGESVLESNAYSELYEVPEAEEYGL